MHFYGVVLSLAGATEVDLYDQWDNRQFGRLHNSFNDFDRHLETLGLTSAEIDRAGAKLRAIRAAASFPELYRALGMSYIVDKAGVLEPVAGKQYDIVCSLDVLEHVAGGDVDRFLRATFGALKPGGVSLHQIGLDDHLTHYDRSTSTKQYVAYGDAVWNLRFANPVQPVNRLSYDHFRAAFWRAGFEEVDVVAQEDPEALRGITVAPQFAAQSQQSLHAVRALMVHRKPANAS